MSLVRFSSALLLSIFTASTATADPCVAEEFVSVTLEGSGLSESEQQAFLVQLGAGFESAELGFCANAQENGRKPIARLEVKSLSDDKKGLTLSVVDQVTNKRVERAVDLASYTAEARVFALSVASEELLLATWAELLVARTDVAGQTKAKPPAQVLQAVEDRSQADGKFRIGLGFRVETPRFSELRLGPEVRGRYFLGQGPFLEVSTLYVASLAQTDSSGSLSASNLGIGLGGGHIFRRGKQVEFEASLLTRFGLERLSFRSNDENFVGTSVQEFTFSAELGLGMALACGQQGTLGVTLFGGPVIVGAQGESPSGAQVGMSDYTVGGALSGEFGL